MVNTKRLGDSMAPVIGTMTPERKKALERIVKLLALAEDKGATEAEAEAAREAAYRLMAEYNVSSAREATTEPFEMRQYPSPFVRDEWWDRRLRAAVAELNNCWLVWWEPSWEAPQGQAAN
jgi:hypothetical protein